MFIVEELSAIFFTKEIYVTNFMHISCVSSTIGNLRIFPVSVSVSVYLLYNYIIIYIKCVYIILVPRGPGGQ